MVSFPFSHEDQRNYFWIVLMMAGVFLLSANRAWLNPEPGYEVVKVPKSIPFLWQYDLDAGLELYSAAHFPQGYRTFPQRINRPVYPILVKCLGDVVCFPLKIVKDLHPMQRAAVGYILLKWIVYLGSAVLYYHMVKRFFDASSALFAVFLLYFHSFSIKYFGTFHTTELQFIAPIFTVALFLPLVERSRITANILLSILFGVLMLAKQNYSIYLAILLFAVWHKHWLGAGISLVSHFIPLLIWLIGLKLIGIAYYNHEMEVYQQGSWVYQDLIFRSPLEIARILLEYFFQYWSHLAAHHTFLIFLCAMTIPTLFQNAIHRKILLFFAFLLFANWAQMVAANRGLPYMTADVSFMVCACAAYGVMVFVRERSLCRKSILTGLALFWFIIHVFYFVHFPWVHPKDQPERAPQQVLSAEEFQNMQ